MTMPAGEPARRSPGRPPQISRARVLAAALTLADEHGLDALTMAAVAGRLGVTPMALYRHVSGKAGLLDGMVELLLTEFPPPPAGLPWPDRLGALAASIRASARRHPGVFPLLLQRPAATPQALRTREGVYAALRQAGLPEDRIPQAERLLSTAVLGFAASEATGRFRDHASAQLDADFGALQRMLRDYVQTQARPAMPGRPPD
jgi:AcrR family transcriptional regulator